MGAIAASDAKALFTKKLIDVYREKTTPTSFLRSFFKVEETATKELSIEVQRGTEKFAVDVERGTEGNRNQFLKSTEKIFVPPFYREYFDATELSLYDRLFGSTEIDAGIFSAFLNQVAEKLRTLQDIIERAYEKQCSEVLDTGIVNLTAGINIDFKRKAGSLVDNSGTPWTGANDPFAQIAAGCKILRQQGKTMGNTFNLIVGETALAAFFNNSFVKDTADIRRIDHVSIRRPQRDSVGGTTHGEFSANDYNIRLWSYPEFFDDASDVQTPFINPKKAILLPENPRFILGFAAVPQLLTKGESVKTGAFIVGDYIDERNAKHVFDIKSAGVAIPVGVDMIYTMQVTA
ncbi:hypothetical protein LCGC14_0593600 [marine sediment metagenome]|uniref:Uncharacterized protein n=1 Tax=marine sediment metagenome TaxID=412755 RepID=A0A0F9RCQ9_9ZZZZ